MTAPLATLEKFVDTLAAQGGKTCALIGGEPTCYPYLLELIAYIKSKGVKPHMISNGRKLANIDFVRSLKRAGLESCAISIEGIGQVHDEMVGVRGAFTESIKGICNCMTLGIRTKAITTLQKKNYEDVEAIIQCFGNLGIPRLSFNLCSLKDLNDSRKPNSTGLLDLKTYATLATSMAEKYDFVHFYGLVPLCFYDTDRALPLIQRGKIDFACTISSDYLSVDPEGEVLVCNHMHHISIGNLIGNGITAIIEAKARLREKFQTEAPSKKCVSCLYWNTCKGGCSLLWMRLNAEEVIPGYQMTN
jgi:radical SAM protein with 4Fe4S-binding SPASM domain